MPPPCCFTRPLFLLNSRTTPRTTASLALTAATAPGVFAARAPPPPPPPLLLLALKAIFNARSLLLLIYRAAACWSLL